MSGNQDRTAESSRISNRSDAIGILLFGASIVLSQICSSYWNRKRRRNTSKSDDDKANNDSPHPSRRTNRLVRYLSSNYSSKWSHYSDDQESFIQQLPKVELHVHLDGSFDPDFLYDFLQRHPERMKRLPVSILKPPWDPLTDELIIREKVIQACTGSTGENTTNPRERYHQLCTCRGRHSLTEMLNCFQMFLPVVQGDLSLIEILAYDFCQRQYQQNIVYTEVRYSPHLLAYGPVNDIDDDVAPVSAQDVVHAITKGLRRGTAETGIVVNQILCAISWRPDWAMSIVELAERFRDNNSDDNGRTTCCCAVVGIDIAAGEEHFDPASPFHGPHVEMAREALAKNIPMTVHAGEVPNDDDDDIAEKDHVARAVTEYNARRIGHGYRMATRPETMQFIRDHNVHVEACLTSSVETGGWVHQIGASNKNVREWPTHPARAMLDHGVSLSLSSDDPAVFHTSLAWQYRTALAKMKTTPSELIRTNFDAIDAAFCSDGTKRDIKQLLVAFADERGIPGFELERSVHGLPPEQRQSLLRQSETPNFTDRVYLANAEYS